MSNAPVLGRLRSSGHLDIAIAGRRIRLHSDMPEVQGYLVELFKESIVREGHTGLFEGEAYFVADLAESASEDRPSVFLRDDHAVSIERRKRLEVSGGLGICRLSDTFTRQRESFFYNYVKPTMLEVLLQLGILHCHGAGLRHQTIGNLLIIGPRGSGKTTLSLAGLRSGHCLLSDDILLLNPDLRKVFTIPRPLHADPSLASVLDMQAEFQRAPEYLPGTNRIEIDLDDRYPELALEFMNWPRALLLPWIQSQSGTAGCPVAAHVAAIRLLSQLYPGINRARSFPILIEILESLLDIPAISLRLGPDALASPELPFQVIERILA